MGVDVIERPSTLAILFTEDPTALQYWSELYPHPHHPQPIHTHKTNGSKKEGSTAIENEKE